MVYLRMAVYTVAALAASAGVGTYDAQAQTLTLHLDEIVIALTGAGAINWGILALWGKK